MDLTLASDRRVLVVGALAAILAIMPLGGWAAGVDASGLVEACRAIMGGLAGAVPCAAGH